MNEEEKNNIAIKYAKQGIDLEKVEEATKKIIEIFSLVFNLAIKNRKVLDKYCKNVGDKNE